MKLKLGLKFSVKSSLFYFSFSACGIHRAFRRILHPEIASVAAIVRTSAFNAAAAVESAAAVAAGRRSLPSKGSKPWRGHGRIANLLCPRSAQGPITDFGLQICRLWLHIDFRSASRLILLKRPNFFLLCKITAILVPTATTLQESVYQGLKQLLL